ITTVTGSLVVDELRNKNGEFRVDEKGNVRAGDVVISAVGDIRGLKNTKWDPDNVVENRAATEGQLKDVSDTVNAGWIATDNNGSQVNITPDNNKLNFAGDENITVTAAANNEIKTTLNDNITLGEGVNQIQLNGDPEANDPALSVGNKFVVEQDGSLTAQTENSKIALGETQASIKVGDNFVDVNNTNVSIEGNQTRVDIGENGAEFRYGNEDVWGYTEIKGGQILTDKVVANDSMIIGDVSTRNYINIDGTTNTITGLSNTTWDDELAKQVANSEELQGTAATQGQLQQAVSEVAEVANAGWNAQAGGNTINVKPNETLNFEGDGNITVSATSGTSSELKFGLNHNITLDNVENANTMLVLNTDGKNADGISGYIPENYKDDEGHINDFIQEHGGFAIYYANPSLATGDMTGTFGVTTDGVVHAKDVVSYYSASGGGQGDVIRYSLNDVGDIVTQIAHSQFDVTGMDYTVISAFKSEEDKEDPFQTPEGTGERTIGLAVREDGAVVIGAVVGEDGLQKDELGIRINDDSIAGGGKDTITGLDNTEWTPPTNSKARDVGDTRIASMAATQGQLDDLYNAVAAYDVKSDGTIDYSHIALAGTPYGASRAGNGTPTGGTSITNVAYASGKDGSEAVNVDYLNDAISDAAENGSISTSDQHLVANTETGSNGVYKPNDDGNVNLIVSDEKGNSSTITIGDVASKEDLDNLKDDVGDLDYSKVEGDTIIDGDSVTDAIGKLDNKIDNITGTATDADNNTVTGGKINSDGTISLTQKDKDSIKLEGQLTDSGVVQEGTSFDKETGTITITSQDKYSGETSSVKVEGIASTEVVGATNKEDLATAYKDADKDGNATTEYITDSESMVEADVALDHAIQDVANTSYANDMVLSNRIDSVEKRLGNVEERIDKVGAMAAAIANLRTMGFDPEAPTEIAIGVGQYKSETGIAIGVFHYPNQDFMLSASLSSSGDELMGGIGATWKLGRKSAAERAKDEEARHLEQAEEMKKLAQQEKVKAQAQRHAKLLAERQQASQKNA
ncbi:MAG: YadA C-terminal domain-containing protein, partial [Megamonas funiformis]|uniref:YadA C-terminal domain-containing protein n=1 Tax=Megamonas funiformis TaxID=437897 RepID=UPI002A82CE0D